MMAVYPSLEYFFACSKQTSKLDRRLEAARASGTDMRDTAVGCWKCCCCTLPQDKQIVRALVQRYAFQKLAKQFSRKSQFRSDKRKCKDQAASGRTRVGSRRIWQLGTLTWILEFTIMSVESAAMNVPQPAHRLLHHCLLSKRGWRRRAGRADEACMCLLGHYTG